jgi:hypothetical protein
VLTQGAAGGGAPVECDGRNDNYDSIVSDLASLIEHVEASMKPIESAIARDASPAVRILPPTLSFWTTSRLVT